MHSPISSQLPPTLPPVPTEQELTDLTKELSSQELLQIYQLLPPWIRTEKLAPPPSPLAQNKGDKVK